MSHGLPRRIVVEIGELSLRGFLPEQRRQIVDQLEDGLVRMLADPATAVDLGLGRNARLPTLKLSLPATSASSSGSPSMGERAAGTIVRALRP